MARPLVGRLHGAYAVAVLLYLLVPLALAVPLSLTASEVMLFPPRGITLRWYEEFITDPNWTGPTFVSLVLAAHRRSYCQV